VAFIRIKDCVPLQIFTKKQITQPNIQLNKMQINMNIVFLSLLVIIASVTAAPVPSQHPDGKDCGHPFQPLCGIPDNTNDER
jgi:hypothetical protein